MRKKLDQSERASQLADGWVVAGGDPVDASSTTASANEPTVDELTGEVLRTGEVSNLTLVLYGVFGGMYLLYTVGWFFIAQYFANANAVTASTSGIIGGILQIIVFWAAALAPVGWFATTLVLSRTRHAWFLPVALMLGLVVLVPLPLFVGGSGS